MSGMIIEVLKYPDQKYGDLLLYDVSCETIHIFDGVCTRK